MVGKSWTLSDLMKQKGSLPIIVLEKRMLNILYNNNIIFLFKEALKKLLNLEHWPNLGYLLPLELQTHYIINYVMYNDEFSPSIH